MLETYTGFFNYGGGSVAYSAGIFMAVGATQRHQWLLPYFNPGPVSVF